MGPDRLWLIVAVVLVVAVTSAAATELGVAGSRFTVDGQPTFLLGTSYYGALGAANEFVLQDLDSMQKSGFNWIRVWATWSAFDNDVSAVDGSGRARQPYLAKLKWLVAECDRCEMIVDVTLTRGEGRLGNAHVATLDTHLQALETLVSELKPWRNWYVDVANEHNLRSRTVASKFVSIEAARRLRDGVKRVDGKRLVTISYVGDISKEEVRRYVDEVQVDFLSPHRPRSARSPGATPQVTREYLAEMRDLGRVVPVHYQEPFRRDFSKGWQPTAEHFVDDLRGAVESGAAGWCFHNGDNRWADDAEPRRSFDMRSKRLFEQLDTVEWQAVNQFGAAVEKALENRR
jgi:hypothetical protein